jgi:hypothetical protein
MRDSPFMCHELGVSLVPGEMEIPLFYRLAF